MTPTDVTYRLRMCPLCQKPYTDCEHGPGALMDRITQLEAAIANTHDGREFIQPDYYINHHTGDEEECCGYCGEQWPCWAAKVLGLENAAPA